MPMVKTNKLKGQKQTYSERWESELRCTVPMALSGPRGDGLRRLIAEIRREHRISRWGDPSRTEEKEYV